MSVHLILHISSYTPIYIYIIIQISIKQSFYYAKITYLHTNINTRMCALMRTIYMHARSYEHYCQFPCQTHIDQAKVSTEKICQIHMEVQRRREKVNMNVDGKA